jgi:hypothetical protein
MKSAIQLGQLRLFNKLVATGWVDRVGKAQVAQLFAQYAAGCSPVLVDAAADAGIDIDEPDLQRGRTALDNLANVATAHLCGNREAERLALLSACWQEARIPTIATTWGRLLSLQSPIPTW